MKSFGLLACFGAALLAAGCGRSTSALPKQPVSAAAGLSAIEYVAPDSQGIQTMTLHPAAIPEYLDLPAHVEPDPTLVVRVYPPAGGRITQMKVRPWDRVEKGQTLALLESGDLARAVADYHKAEADNQVKQSELVRAQDLFAHFAISQRDYQQAEADARMSQADLQSAREQVRVFGMDPDQASSQLLVSAPRAGVVLEVGAAPGEFSQALASSAPLCTIADISTLWAVGDVYEKDLAAARSGEPAQVTLDAYPGQTWAGRVSIVGSAVDPVTRTLRVRVVLPNPEGHIKPGMFGSIRLLRSSQQGLLVPPSAVIREGNDVFIFVARGNGRFERRSVTLGRSVDGSLEILSGVKPGETVVSQGALFLRAGTQD
jgi:membrane fusion protein, heavy metal efflux system